MLDILQNIKQGLRKRKRMKVLFHADSGHILKGISSNIYHDSLCFWTSQRCGLNRGDTGKLLVKCNATIETFDGKVMRLIDDGLVIRFYGQQARDFFFPFRVSDTRCRNCGSTKYLEQCPGCKGINTICSTCIKHDTTCMECRAAQLLFKSRQLMVS